MDNYVKDSVVDLDDHLPLSVEEGGVVMKVVAGSKIKNLMVYALKRMKEPQTTQIIWHGSGKAVYKTINCAEIMKQKIENLHQISRLYEKRIEEFWNPKIEGLDRLKVNRDIPAICILLSRTPLNSSELGYQPPGPFRAFWSGLANKSAQNQHLQKSQAQLAVRAAEESPSFKPRKRKKKRQEKDTPGPSYQTPEAE